MEVDILLIILSLLCALVGLLGAVLPALPGPTLAFVGMLLLFFCKDAGISVIALSVSAFFLAVVTLLDYLMPMWLAKLTGGTKKGIWGAGIGMLVGLFFMPLGLLLGPFFGALIGEIASGTSLKKAFGVSFMSFVAFMLTTGIKFIYVLIVFMVIVVKAMMLLT